MHAFVICHDCKTVVSTEVVERVLVPADLDAESPPLVPANACPQCAEARRAEAMARILATPP